MKKKVRLQAGAVASIALMALLAVPAAASSAAASVSSPTIASPGSDPLYISDAGDSTVKRLDATGSSVFATTASDTSDLPGGLDVPAGLIYSRGSLLLANQNEGLSVPGSMLRYHPLRFRSECVLACEVTPDLGGARRAWWSRIATDGSPGRWSRCVAAAGAAAWRVPGTREGRLRFPCDTPGRLRDKRV